MKESTLKLNPYLSFDGQCEEAFEFYARCLGGKIEAMMRYGESPMAEHVPPQRHERILHALLVVGDQVLMGADVPGRYGKPQGFSVSLQIDDPDEAERIFNALSENGTVTMPLERTFWAERFGMLVDRFGIPWMVNCDTAA
jgi:PhnB protein